MLKKAGGHTMTVLSTPLTELLSATARPPVSSSSTAVAALMGRLEPSPEPAIVFKSLTRVAVPVVCDASSVVITSEGQEPCRFSCQVADSAGGAERGSELRTDLDGIAGELVTEDTIVLPINPTVPEGQVAYRGLLTLGFHGFRPTFAHLLIGQLLVERATALVQRERLVRKTENLYRALASNREIGAAMGILMARHQLTSDQAFDLLRRASQSAHRKVVAIAAEIIETGTLELPPGVELLDRRPTPGPSLKTRSQHLRLAR
jgi:ANTAR domain